MHKASTDGCFQAKQQLTEVLVKFNILFNLHLKYLKFNEWKVLKFTKVQR